MIKNHREFAMSRTKMGNCKACILQKRQRFAVKLVDRAVGGVGIIVISKILVQLNITIGQKIVMEFPLCGTKHIDSFIVCSVNENRVGLKYVDGKKMSPQQRSMVGHNI